MALSGELGNKLGQGRRGGVRAPYDTKAKTIVYQLSAYQFFERCVSTIDGILHPKEVISGNKIKIAAL